jgi:hypothetical protein
MTLCVIDGKQCQCQPDEGVPCTAGSAAEVQAKLNAEIMLLQSHINLLDKWETEGEEIIKHSHAGIMFRLGEWWGSRPWSK